MLFFEKAARQGTDGVVYWQGHERTHYNYKLSAIKAGNVPDAFFDEATQSAVFEPRLADPAASYVARCRHCQALAIVQPPQP